MRRFFVTVTAILTLMYTACWSSPSYPSSSSYSGNKEADAAGTPLQKISPAKSVLFKESTGKAIVTDRTLTYWLYQIFPNDMEELIGYFHSYVESIGYVVDYDSFSGMYENPDLATSVRRLMLTHKRNISVTIWDNVLIVNVDATEDGSIEDRVYYFLSWDLYKE